MGVCVPAELGGAGADFLSYILVLEELSRARCRRRRHRRRPHERLHAADPRLRHRGAARALRAAAGERAGDRRLRAHRAGGRLRRGLDPDAGGRRRGRLDDHRREAVDHERQLRGHVPHLRPQRARDRGRARRLRVPARRRARARDARGGEARPQLVLDRRSRDRGRAGRPRPAAARGGPRLRDRDVDARRRPDRHRRPGARDRAGRVRRRPRLREGAAHLRQADRRAPGDPVQARGHVDGDRRGAAARLPGGLAEGAGRAAHRGGREGEALRLGDGAPPDRRGDPDPRRLRLHEGVPRRALLPRREDHRDLRGDERDPAPRDRPPDPGPAA